MALFWPSASFHGVYFRIESHFFYAKYRAVALLVRCEYPSITLRCFHMSFFQLLDCLLVSFP